MLRFWVSWYHEEPFGELKLEFPWWTTGWRCSDYADTICAAVIAPTQEGAEEIIYKACEFRPEVIEFRFVDSKPDDWIPFNERFRSGKEKWRKWANATDGKGHD